MSDVPQLPRLPTPNTPYERELNRVLERYLRQIAASINNHSQGSFAAFSAVSATKPTLPGKQNDYIQNSAKEVLGTEPAQYVVLGWIYADGEWLDVTAQTDGTE